MLIHVPSGQPRVTVTSCLVYKVIRDLESIDHLCINPIHRTCTVHGITVTYILIALLMSSNCFSQIILGSFPSYLYLCQYKELISVRLLYDLCVYTGK